MQPISSATDNFYPVGSRQRYRAMLANVLRNVLRSGYLTLHDRWSLAQALISTCLTPDDLRIIDYLIQNIRQGQILYDQTGGLQNSD